MKRGIKKGTKLQRVPMAGIMLRLSVQQADALQRLAAERGVNRAEIIRGLIAGATGVPDTVIQKRPTDYNLRRVAEAKRRREEAAS